MTPDPAKAARELLAFYVEAGVDGLVADAPTNWLADPATTLDAAEPRPPQPREQSFSPPANERRPRELPSLPPKDRPAGDERSAAAAAAPLAPDVAIMAAREAAKSAATLDELRAILSTFQGCALRTTATQVVFADGNPQARLMFLGEAPGRDEDLAGLPFVGRSGQLLDRMLAAIGRDRASAYIANIVPWRPPGNRKPTPQEAAICLPFLQRQVELADPDVLVCLGDSSAQTLLGFKEGITRTRGRWLDYDTGTRRIRAIATFHPAYLLRTPLSKRLAWRDFLAIKKALAQS
jgi:DNA polymerase